MTFLFFAAMYAVAQGRLGNDNAYFHVRACLVMGCAMLASLLAARYLGPFLTGAESSPRTELNFDVLWMGYWYVRVLLLVAIPNYVVHESVLWMLVSIPVVVTGFLYLCRNKRVRLYVLFCMVAVHSPVMFTEGSNSGFRTTLPMEMFTCAFFIVGLLAIFHFKPRLVRATLCVILPCLTFYNVYVGYVRAQQVDLAVLEEKLLAEVAPDFEGVVSYDATNGPRCRFEPCRPPSEFGITSTYQPWSGRGMLEHLKRKHGMAFESVRMTERDKADYIIIIDR